MGLVGVEMRCPKQPFEATDCTVFMNNGTCHFKSKKECVAYHLGSVRVAPAEGRAEV